MSDEEALLALTRLGISYGDTMQAGDVEWPIVQALAAKQGLSAIVLDGIEKLPENQRPPQKILLSWIGEVVQSYESRYELYKRTIAEMAGFYKAHGLRMMLLKGYACGLDWSKPNHRPYGDIDIWQFGEQKKADGLLSLEKGIKVDNSHHHHTVFCWNEFLVENHYDFINTKELKSSKGLERVFKNLGTDDSNCVEVNGEKVYLPSANLHALFLMRHLVAHFTSVSITLRQVLDWAFFVEKHTKEVDWDWVMGVLKKFHMIEFYNTINAICVEDLGFEESIFPSVNFRPDLKDRVLNDILYPKYSASEPSRLIPRLIYKYRRWQGNAWKQELCYSESRWSAFWSGIWGHLLKPASI